MSKKGKILVAMSGGLDSTVAAVMLSEEGYEVIGVTMKTIAVKHGIHHMILDIRDEFGDFVIDNFVEEYLAGRTPNPCVLCNTHIKWEALLKRANMLDCEFIATGHYAQVRNENNRFVISKGLDDNKDQSYVLWGLTQQSLAKTQFPLGGFRKTDIRQMAIDMGYEELANKSESYEICFVPDNDYRGFLKRKVDGLEAKVEGGNFTNSEGKIIGKHRGYPFYTIGQRKGLEIAFGEPMFVLAIYPETNTVVLGREVELQQKGMWVRNINMGKFESVLEPMESLTKIRYKDAGSMANIQQEGDRMKVIFNNHVKAIAPGQSAVFYDGNDVIGGGWIQGSFDV